jgi:HEAT repeat protein
MRALLLSICLASSVVEIQQEKRERRSAAADLSPSDRVKVSEAMLALKSQDYFERVQAATDLQFMGAKARAAVPALQEALHDKQLMVRMAAAMALWQIDRREDLAVPVLLAAVKDQDPGLRVRAATMLVMINPHKYPVLQVLISGLETGDAEHVRGIAATALGQMGPAAKAGVPALIQALKDREKSVRFAAP